MVAQLRGATIIAHARGEAVSVSFPAVALLNVAGWLGFTSIHEYCHALTAEGRDILKREVKGAD
jgi:hypothetical protein